MKDCVEAHKPYQRFPIPKSKSICRTISQLQTGSHSSGNQDGLSYESNEDYSVILFSFAEKVCPSVPRGI